MEVVVGRRGEQTRRQTDKRLCSLCVTQLLAARQTRAALLVCASAIARIHLPASLGRIVGLPNSGLGFDAAVGRVSCCGGALSGATQRTQR